MARSQNFILRLEIYKEGQKLRIDLGDGRFERLTKMTYLLVYSEVGGKLKNWYPEYVGLASKESHYPPSLVFLTEETR